MKMNQNNVKRKRKNLQKPSNADPSKLNKNKSKNDFEKVKTQNSKIIFDDEGTEKVIKKKNAKKSSYNQWNQKPSDDVTSRWYQEVSHSGGVILLPN